MQYQTPVLPHGGTILVLQLEALWTPKECYVHVKQSVYPSVWNVNA